MIMHQPAGYNTECKDKKDHQGPGHGSRPEHEADFDNLGILDQKNYQQPGENQTKNQLRICHKTLPLFVWLPENPFIISIPERLAGYQTDFLPPALFSPIREANSNSALIILKVLIWRPVGW